MGCREYIKEYLQKHGASAGGTIEREIASFTKYKPSNVSRRLREMQEEGIVIAEYKKLQGSPSFVIYKLK